eukprot:2174447-Pyramimonas_sp.AAC.2
MKDQLCNLAHLFDEDRGLPEFSDDCVRLLVLEVASPCRQTQNLLEQGDEQVDVRGPAELEVHALAGLLLFLERLALVVVHDALGLHGRAEVVVALLWQHERQVDRRLEKGQLSRVREGEPSHLAHRLPQVPAAVPATTAATPSTAWWSAPAAPVRCLASAPARFMKEGIAMSEGCSAAAAAAIRSSGRGGPRCLRRSSA